MILLLDATAVIWWLGNDPAMSVETRRTIADPRTDVLVSAATVWEIEIKRTLGKLDAPGDLLERLDLAGFTTLPITGADAQRASRLPGHHRDPFDRMLVAQAVRLGAIIVSRDRAFDAYGAEVLPA